MDSEAVAGLIGVVLGAALATVGTWLVSTWLERRRDDRRLYGVIGLLSEELKNNQHRIEAHRDGAKREDWRGVLTLGDWDANKAAFSQLIWRAVCQVGSVDRGPRGAFGGLAGGRGVGRSVGRCQSDDAGIGCPMALFRRRRAQL